MKDYKEMAESLFERRDKYMKERKRKMNTIMKAASGLSCFCLAVLSGFLIQNAQSGPGANSVSGITPVKIDIPERDTQNMDPGSQEDLSEGSGGAVGNVREESEKNNSGATQYGSPNTQHSSIADANNNISELQSEKESGTEERDADTEESTAVSVSDLPVSEQSPGSLTHLTASGSSADFFGGSYTNSQGLLCILLTEDTPENRAVICRELNLNENNVVFRNAQYTLSYLTELQARISQGMISKELNFVTVSSLREDTNRIHLSVTTRDASLLEKLNALDTLGGALEIEYQSDSSTESSLLEKLNALDTLEGALEIEYQSDNSTLPQLE